MMDDDNLSFYLKSNENEDEKKILVIINDFSKINDIRLQKLDVRIGYLILYIRT